MADVKVLIERARYMVGNPSAWDSYDEGASNDIAALITALEQMQQANNALMAERTNLIATKREQIDRLMKERDEAREALKPFARIVDGTEHEHDGASVIVNVNLLRAARSALSTKEAAE